MDIYNFVREKYNEQQRTGRSSINFPELKQINKSLKKENIDVYSCNHPHKTIIMNTNICTLSTYCEWLNNNSNKLCLDCWIKNRNKGT